MRILTIIVCAAVVGSAFGWVAAQVHFRLDPDKPSLVDRTGAPGEATQASTAGKPAPRIEVAASKFQFGKMQRGTRKSHVFNVKNVGEAPLVVHVARTTCKCTVGVANDEPIPPGETAEVRLDWHATSEPGPFSQTATLTTNDPLQTQVSLEIIGEIIEAHGVEPPNFLFDKVTAGESKSATVYVMAMFQNEVNIDRAELSHSDMRDYFDVKLEPVSREELPNPEAKAGVRVTVTAKPNLPLGFFNPQLKLHTNLTDAQDLDIPITGRVIGDISIHGENWDDANSVLRVGGVSSSSGSTPARLTALIRGENAENIKLNVLSTDPPELKATLGEPRVLKAGLVQVPLTIVVPPGTPPMVRLGTDQGEAGHIIIGTTHPTVKELRLDVRFSVER